MKMFLEGFKKVFIGQGLIWTFELGRWLLQIDLYTERRIGFEFVWRKGGRDGHGGCRLLIAFVLAIEIALHEWVKLQQQPRRAR